MIIFRGGTDLAIVAAMLVDNHKIGTFYEPAEAKFDLEDDADAFEGLLRDGGIPYTRSGAAAPAGYSPPELSSGCPGS